MMIPWFGVCERSTYIKINNDISVQIMENKMIGSEGDEQPVFVSIAIATTNVIVASKDGG